MATKVKLMTFLQQVRGYAEITNRRPAPRPPMLYLMDLRRQSGNVQSSRRRLAVKSSATGESVPLPVKITHYRAGESPFPVVVD